MWPLSLLINLRGSESGQLIKDICSVTGAEQILINWRCYMNSLSVCRNILQKISSLIRSDDFLESHRMANRFVRKGLLTITHIIVYLLYTSKQSMSINLSNILQDLPQLEFPKVTKQAVSKARQGILPSLFKELFDASVDEYYKSIGVERKKWKDMFHIFAVDGSRISIPNSKSNFENYGEMFSKQNPDRKWSMALCSTIYDVCNDIIVHGLLKRYLGSERYAALQHCAELEKLDLFKDAVVIFDRGYYSDAMFRYFAAKGYLCIMRIREGFNLAKQCTGDCILTLSGDKKKGTEDISVRVIAIPLDGGETEYLATSIFDESLSTEDFKDLYFMRWPIELKYGELKNQCLLEEFSGATSTSIEQEFFINLLMSNLSSMVKSAADKHIEENSNSNNKCRYQANRAYIIARMKWFMARFVAGVCEISLLENIFEGACAIRSQIQPGRKSPRNKKAHARERKHFNNRKQVI